MTTILLVQSVPPLPPVSEMAPEIARLYRDRGIDSGGGLPRVLGTRHLAREVIRRHPYDRQVVLDFTGAEAVSGPFMHELLKHWPEATAVGMNEDVAATWGIVTEPRDETEET